MLLPEKGTERSMQPGAGVGLRWGVGNGVSLYAPTHAIVKWIFASITNNNVMFYTFWETIL